MGGPSHREAKVGMLDKAKGEDVQAKKTTPCHPERSGDEVAAQSKALHPPPRQARLREFSPCIGVSKQRPPPRKSMASANETWVVRPIAKQAAGGPSRASQALSS